MSTKLVSLSAVVLSAAAAAQAVALPGSVRFSHAGGGAAAGSFASTDVAPGVAVRIRAAADTTLLVAAAVKTGRGYARISIQLDGAAPGEYDPRAWCEDRCANVVVELGARTPDGDPERACTLYAGEVRVSAVSEAGVEGTFRGQGMCVADEVSEEEFEVSSGTFEVPLAEAERSRAR